MLKLFVLLILTTFTFSVFACYKVEGQLGIDGETFPLNQKIELNKEYSLPQGSFILSFTVKAAKKKGEYHLKYKVEEKKGTTLAMVTFGEEDLSEAKSRDIYAAGEKDQPHSILTLKITDI